MRYALALWLFLTPAVAWSDPTDRVLSLCLDITETPETRVSALLADGWRPSDDGITGLTVALTLTRINAGDPTNWNADRTVAADLAVKAISTADTVYLENPDAGAAVFIGRDWRGLQTCLYLGAKNNLAPVDQALDGSFIYDIKEVSRIRGDGVKSLISAHAMSEKGRAMFDPPLAYAMTFSVRLDRQPGD